MNKIAIIMLIVGLIVAWILASSINVITVNNQSKGTNLGNRGGGSGIRIPNLPTINYTLPNITYNFKYTLYNGSIGNVKLVSVPIILPQIHIPNVKLTSLSGGKGNGVKSGLRGGIGNGVGSGNGIGNGNSGSSGNSGGNSQSAIVNVTIPPFLYIILLILVVIILATSSFFIARKTILNRLNTPQMPQISSQVSLPKKIIQKTTLNYEKKEIKLLPKEILTSFKGWGGSNVIGLPIPNDLPLIWDYRTPLPVYLKKEGYTLTNVGNKGIIADNKLYMPEPGCYAIKVNNEKGEESIFFIRGVNYDEDVIRLIRVNIGEVESPRTIREIMRDSNSYDSNVIIRTFEDVKYGHKNVDKVRYEEFLRGIGRTFNKVIICESA